MAADAPHGSTQTGEGAREGSLDAPTRHPIDWKSPEFYDQAAIEAELERVYDICHGCRRCVSLCNAFPTLFDLVDESETMEVDGVAKSDFGKVVDQCYLCDLCYLTKCPYVPPHPWNVDFPHLMLRAKAAEFKKGQTRTRDKVLTSTDRVGSLVGIPVVAQTVNVVNRTGIGRSALEKVLGVHREAPIPDYHARPFRRRFDPEGRRAPGSAVATSKTTGRVAVFTTCYGNYNLPSEVEDLIAVLEHNKIPVTIPSAEKCCGMPKLELGDLETVEKLKDHNIPVLAALVDEGYDLMAVVPSCVLMFKQELPLLFPDDEDVQRVGRAFFDPFEYLMLRHREGQLETDFKTSLGRIGWHVACHQRVQNIGPKTREFLELVPDTEVTPVERCSGHDGTYAVKVENFEFAKKIARPVVGKMEKGEFDHYLSDCPMASDQIENGMPEGHSAARLFALVKRAYGL